MSKTRFECIQQRLDMLDTLVLWFAVKNSVLLPADGAGTAEGSLSTVLQSYCLCIYKRSHWSKYMSILL